MNYFAIQCFPDTYNLVREGPNIDPHVTGLMVRAKKILGHEGRCEWYENNPRVAVVITQISYRILTLSVWSQYHLMRLLGISF